MAPMEIWCNESQERYVRVAVNPDLLPLFGGCCRRERAPDAVVEIAADDRELILGRSPAAGARSTCRWTCCWADRRRCTATSPAWRAPSNRSTSPRREPRRGGVERAASPDGGLKRFLVTIGDCTVGGMSRATRWSALAGAGGGLRGHAGRLRRLRGGRCRWASAPAGLAGCAGLRPLAVAEAITNLLAAPIELSRVKLSANWMAACGRPARTPRSTTPSRRSAWAIARRWASAFRSARIRCRCAPGGATGAKPSRSYLVSLVVTAFVTLDDVRGTLTPQLKTDTPAGLDTTLILIDLGQGPGTMGGSMLAQVLSQFGDTVPDVDDPAQLKALVAVVNEAARGRQAAGLPRPQRRRPVGGGLQMAFAGHVGVSLNVDLLVTEGDGISDSRADMGDSKNWAAGRRTPATS